MTEGTTGGRGRRSTPPSRDILGGQVRDDELPDVARPAPPPSAASAPPSATADHVTDMLHSLIEAGRAPLRVAEAALDGQAHAIAQRVGKGAVPPLLVPGAILLEVQLRAAAGVLRALPWVVPPPRGGTSRP